jgi:hypothetical protein
MEELLEAIQKNSTNKECIQPFTKEQDGKLSNELLWNTGVRGLQPALLQTAWLLKQDPLMGVAGVRYRCVEVRDKTFVLQEEATTTIRGNRKLTKAKIGDALSALKQNEDQRKVVAEVLYTLRQIQTVCFNEEKKTVWTVPSDLRAWSKNYTTLWVDNECQRMLEEEGMLRLDRWLSDREAEGWTIPWPIAEGKLETLKEEAERHSVRVKAVLGHKIVKDDWAKLVGQSQAVRHLVSIYA